VCKRGIVPGVQKLTRSLGRFSIGFAQVSLRGKARTAFSCPLLVQPSKCGSGSAAGREEAEKMAPSFYRGCEPGVCGKVGLFSWQRKEALSSPTPPSWPCDSDWAL